MVGIEENSSDFAKAKDALSGVMSAEALAAVRGAAAWANPKPDMQYASPAAVEPAAYGASEPAAALAFLRDNDETPTQPAGSGAKLTLVADNVVGGGDDDSPAKDVDAANLEKAREAAIVDVEYQLEQAENNHDVQAIARLTTVLQSLRSATSLGAIAIAQGQTSQLSGSDRAETAEAKAERMLQEAVKAEEKAQEELHDAMKKANDEGKITDQEEYKKYLALHDKEEEYKKKHPKWYDNKEQTAVVDAIQAQKFEAARKSTNAPEVHGKIDAAEAKADSFTASGVTRLSALSTREC